MSPLSRREFLRFMSRAALAGSTLPLWTACITANRGTRHLPFSPLSPSVEDDLILAAGFRYQVLVSWGDRLNSQGERFGFNNDFTAFFPLANSADEGILWVNHESVDPLFVSGWQTGQPRRQEDVEREMLEVGGSLIHIKRHLDGWKLIFDSPHNRRLTAKTMIPFVSARPILGKNSAMGTLANCAGGKTPWGTLLTCEENYDNFYGETVYAGEKATWMPGPDNLEWRQFFPNPPEHYGWVVEVNPLTGAAKKLTALGRFCHESATTALTNDGRTVVYSGDDHNDECLYKFIAKRPGSLEEGELFVADLTKGCWQSLDIRKRPELRAKFKDQTEVLIRTREAARLVGGTLLDRPEDVEIDPISKSVFVTLTNNKPKGNLHGSILKIEEEAADHASLKFKWSTFMTGGMAAGFSSPDNMVFDRQGNLWMTNDISDSALNKGAYKGFGNNSLFYIPLSGPAAGGVYRVASAPRTAEFTGPSFSPDGRTLFLSVQHPGEGTTDPAQPLSRWPGRGDKPKPSVVAISGPALDALIQS